MSASSYQMPRRSACPYGTPRRVGVEIEMSGIEEEAVLHERIFDVAAGLDEGMKIGWI